MKVLHVLSQRPRLTGSGVTLAELCRHAGEAGWDQHVVCGLPADEPLPELPGVPASQVTAVRFGRAPLDYDVPGMSDVMPYASTRWRDMAPAQLQAYRDVWRSQLAEALERTRPDVIHAHHLWLASSLIRDVAPGARLVVHCHATGLRQMTLCPGLADEIREGLRRADAVVALHDEQAQAVIARIGLSPDRVHVVGAGFDEDVFHARGRRDDRATDLLYAGKLSAAKGVPWLLDAFAQVRAARPTARLHLVGGAGGAEGETLAARAAEQPGVVVHGRVEDLAGAMRRCRALVLPSLYEGLPLVLIEARACGCRLVATALPGVTSQLAPALGAALDVVPLPRRRDVDVPVAEDLPAFVEALRVALLGALDTPAASPADDELMLFRWSSVFARIEHVWRAQLPGT